MIPRFSPDYKVNDLLHLFLPARKSAIQELEKMMSDYSGHSETLALRYGRSGLYYLLKALGVQNKKVIMPSYTCIVVAHAVVLSGNIPVFLDNMPGSFQPSPDEYFKNIDSDTAMIIPTHLFGITEEVENLYSNVKKNFPHVFILQDCAHSYFCRTQAGHLVSTLGDGAIYGANISKLVNSVHGGFLTLRSVELAQRIRDLQLKDRKDNSNILASLKARLYAGAAAIAFTPLFYSFVRFITQYTSVLDSETQYYNEDQIELPTDFTESLTPFEAEIGLSSLRRFPKRIHARQEIAKIYLKTLGPLASKGLVQMAPTNHKGHTWSHFPLLLRKGKREDLIKQIENKFQCEIGVIVDYSVSDVKSYKEKGHSSTPNALFAAQNIINLPLTLTEGLTLNPQYQEQAHAIANFTYLWVEKNA